MKLLIAIYLLLSSSVVFAALELKLQEKRALHNIEVFRLELKQSAVCR